MQKNRKPYLFTMIPFWFQEINFVIINLRIFIYIKFLLNTLYKSVQINHFWNELSSNPKLLATKLKNFFRRTESYVSHHSTGKHQCTRLGSVPNLSNQASSSINERWKPPYHIRKEKTERHKLKSSVSRSVSKNGCEWDSNSVINKKNSFF